MIASRVAVAPGSHLVRLAGVKGAGAPRLLAEMRARPESAGEHAAALAGLIGPDVDEVVLVYPPGRPSGPVRAWLDTAAVVAPRVRRVSAPVAAAAGTGARAVLDIGRAGAEATLLHGDRIVARRSSGVGGDRLDLAVRDVLPDASIDDARRLRETLSLLPEARHGPVVVDAEQVRAVLTPLLDEAVAALAEVVAVAGELVAVLLTGGVARCPLLAERVDAAAIASDVLVAPRPDLAAVLGALTLPFPTRSGAGSTQPERGASTSASAAPPARAAPPSSVPPFPGPRVGADGLPGESGEPGRGRPADAPGPPRFLTARPSTSRARRWAGAAATAVLVGGIAGAGTAVVVPVRTPAAAASSEVSVGVLVQYGYRLDLPPGWAHTGGLPERRRSLLTRVAAPDGTDLIAVERTPLGYDAGAEPERAATELRAEFDRSVAAGSALSGYGSARIADRDVTTYRQQVRAGAVVEWFVVLDGEAQLSVGCRHTPAGADAVRAACAVVVGSIRRA